MIEFSTGGKIEIELNSKNVLHKRINVSQIGGYRKVTKDYSVERLMNDGQGIHIHSYAEIYGVTKGSATLTVSGDSRLLTEGQMAIVNKYENHSVAIEGESQLLILPVESSVLITFSCLYANKRLPRWLMDVTFNQELFLSIEKIERYAAGPKTEQLQMRITGMVYELLADVIEHYNLENTNQAAAHDMELVARVSQYIDEHYSEKITLETLANEFYISPTVLSKKLRKYLGSDLRVFVNDLRVQKVIEILNDPEQKNRSVFDVAMSCGFKSMSTFYRCYKRNFSLGTLNGAEESQL